MMRFSIFLIFFFSTLLSSCATDLDNWEQVDLTWSDLPDKVQNGMKEGIKPRLLPSGSSVYGDSRLINLDSNYVEASFEYINTGAGTGYIRFNINGEKYNDHSSNHGNERAAPWVLHDKKLYYLKTFGVIDEEELTKAQFCYLKFGEVY